MRRMFIFAVLIACVGCVTVSLPKYIKEESPYTRTFYASYNDTLKATLQVLEDLHWKVLDTAHPSVFEQGVAEEDRVQQILIFTEVRQTPLFLSSKYMSLNVYLRSVASGTEAEVRYVSVTPVFFKHVERYQNDAVVLKILNRIEERLKQ